MTLIELFRKSNADYMKASTYIRNEMLLEKMFLLFANRYVSVRKTILNNISAHNLGLVSELCSDLCGQARMFGLEELASNAKIISDGLREDNPLDWLEPYLIMADKLYESLYRLADEYQQAKAAL